MEEKINIAKILKNKPEKTILYDAMRDINVSLYVVEIKNGETNIFCDGMEKFNGCSFVYSDTGADSIFRKGMQLLKPSKEMRDWSKFSWKKGDILTGNNGTREVLFHSWANDSYTKFIGLHCMIAEDIEGFVYDEGTTVFNTNDFKCIEDEYAVQCYISTIEERLGGKLNRKTLEIEKTQPEFKDGDVVVVDEIPFDLYSKCIFILKENLNTGEIKARAYVLYNVNKDSIFFDTPIMKVIERNIHLATEEEKQQLFDALLKEGKAWDAEKKAIVVKPKVELKPFDKVLCRNSKDDTWEADFFARLTRKEIDYTQSGKYLCVGDLWMYCIPYNEETAHLLGTTDEWKGGEQ